MLRYVAVIVDNIMRVWYATTAVWTFKIWNIRLEKRVAKTLQHGKSYGDILMLYDMISTYELFSCYSWHDLCNSNKLLGFSYIYCFLVKYAI